MSTLPYDRLSAAQYPILRSFIPWQTCSVEHHLDVSGQLLATATHSPVSIVRYTFIKLSELEQCRVNELAQGSTPHLFSFSFLQPCALTPGVPREIGGPVKAEIDLMWLLLVSAAQMRCDRNCLSFETQAGGIEPSSPRLTVRRSTTRSPPPPPPT